MINYSHLNAITRYTTDSELICGRLLQIQHKRQHNITTGKHGIRVNCSRKAQIFRALINFNLSKKPCI